jgi:hypothetical protein
MSSWTPAARLWPDESNTLGEEGAAVELQPTGRLLTREVLDAESAAGRELPIPPDSWLEGHIMYRVTVRGSGPMHDLCLFPALGRRASHAAQAPSLVRP